MDSEEMEETTIVGNPINNTKFQDLPQIIIHHIMNFLPSKDVAKFIVLSKTFHSLWLSFPVLDFDYGFFLKKEDPQLSFMSFILKSLHFRCRHHINKSLQRLRIDYTHSDTGNFPFEVVFDALLAFALENKIKEIMFYMSGVKIQVRDGFFLRIFSSQFLNVLHLRGLIFQIADPVIQCVNLKELLIELCEGLQTVTVSSLLVETVRIDFCDRLKRVELKGKNMLSCRIVGVESDTGEFIQCDIACESIKQMHLEGVKVSKDLMEIVIGSLFVSECYLPGSLRVHNPNILDLYVERNYELEDLFLFGRKLEYFRYESSFGKKCTVNIFECVALRHLMLKGLAITDEWVRSTMPNLGCLKELRIIDCYGLEKMELKNGNLEILSLKRCHNLIEANVDAPNLLRFDYTGIPQVYPMQVSSTKCSVANIKLPPCNLDTLLWFGNLKDFLSCFDHIKCLTITCFQTEDLIFPRVFVGDNASPLRILKYIEVQPLDIPEGETLRKLVESTLWLVHKPLELTFCISGRDCTLKFAYDAEVKRMMVKEKCCVGIPTKCWRHYAPKVDIQGFEESEKNYSKGLFVPYI